jgi:hypothetical protein
MSIKVYDSVDAVPKGIRSNWEKGSMTPAASFASAWWTSTRKVGARTGPSLVPWNWTKPVGSEDLVSPEITGFLTTR